MHATIACTQYSKWLETPLNTTALDPSNQYSLNGPQDMLSQYDSTYNVITETSDGKDYIQEVGGVGPHPTYDVITTENISIDHGEDDHTEGKAPLYSVIAEAQRKGEETEEGKPTIYSVVVEPKKEGEHTDEGEMVDTPTSTEYSKLHYNYNYQK